MPDIKTISQRIKEYRDSKKFKKLEFDACAACQKTAILIQLVAPVLRN